MSLTEEETNFIRFYYFNMTVATKAVRKYFNSKYGPSALAGELKKNEEHLKGLSCITSPQKTMLYPGSGKNVKSEHFDITLMIFLLRNMQPCQVPPAGATHWDKLPHATDTSNRGDLARVKHYRNFVSHDENGSLSGTDFSKYWGDLEQAIIRLGGPSMHTVAQSAKNVVLDSSHRDMLLKLRNLCLKLKNCEKLQQQHIEKIDNLQAAIDFLKTNEEELKKKVQQLNVSHQEMEAETQKQTTKLSDYKDTVYACTQNIVTWKKDITLIKQKIKELQDQIENVITQIGKLEIKYEHDDQQDKLLKEHEERLTMHDEQMTHHGKLLTNHGKELETCVKSIDDMKQRLHDTDYTSGLVADTGIVNRNSVRRRGTVPFTSLTLEILNSLPVENNQDMNRKVQEFIKERIEAKFQETDVVLAINKFTERKGRRPFLMEFYDFINSWEGMPTRKKSFGKLINENIEFRQENRVVKDETRVVNNDKKAVEEKNRDLNEQIRRTLLQLGIAVLCNLSLVLFIIACISNALLKL